MEEDDRIAPRPDAGYDQRWRTFCGSRYKKTVLDSLLNGRRMVQVGSNGTALNDSMLRFLVERKLYYLSVSLDGMQEYHNRIRGMPMAFQRADIALKTLNALKRELRTPYPATCIKCVITDDNYDEIPMLLEYADKELNADHFSLSLESHSPFRHGFESANDLSDERLRRGSVICYPIDSIPGISAMLQKVLAYRRKSRIHVELAPAFNNTESFLQCMTNPAKFGVCNCRRPWTELTMLYDGEITSCLNYRIANVRELDYNVCMALKLPRHREFLTGFSAFHFHPACQGCCLGRHKKNIGAEAKEIA